MVYVGTVSREKKSALHLTNDVVIRHQNNYNDITSISLYSRVNIFVILSNIQGGREISDIILTDDYLCYKEPKIPFNFFLI